jgi:hypothetical protein
MALVPSLLLVKRNGEIYADDWAHDRVFLGLAQKVGTKWSATSAITHVEETNFRIRHDALWWLIEQYEGDK